MKVGIYIPVDDLPELQQVVQLAVQQAESNVMTCRVMGAPQSAEIWKKSAEALGRILDAVGTARGGGA